MEGWEDSRNPLFLFCTQREGRKGIARKNCVNAPYIPLYGGEKEIILLVSQQRVEPL